MVKFLREHKAAKKFLAKDERFRLLLQSTTMSIFPAFCEFCLSVARDMEPLSNLFQVRVLLFLVGKMRQGSGSPGYGW